MNAAQILPFAAAAGFTGGDLANAVAIALAESSGNPNVPGDNGTSFGLWQIHLPAHPEFAGWNLYDPQTNANAAYSIYRKRGGFSDWTTYGNGHGVYLDYLPDVLSALQALLPPAPQPAPLTIDASTGLPVSDGSVSFAEASMLPVTPIAGGLSIGSVLLWAALGLAALWIFEEAA